MDIQQLKYFLAACKTSSYTKAANSLYISRQAVAQSVKQLEKALGFPLFEKEKTPLVLTPLGQVFALEAEKVVSHFNRFESDMYRYASAQSGSLRIAVGAGILPHLNVDLITDFSSTFPNILLSTSQEDNQTIFQLLEDGSIDVGLVGSCLPFLSGFSSTMLLKSDLCILVHKDNPLAKKEALTIMDLDGVPIVGHGEGYDLHRFYLNQCKALGIIPTFSIISSDPIVSLRMVEQNRSVCFGYTDLSEESLSLSPSLIAKNLLTEEEDTWGIYAITKKGEERSLYQRLFIDFLSQHVTEEGSGFRSFQSP